MINKRLCKSKKFAQLKSDRSRVLYVLMYTHADCEGKFIGDPEEIKIDCCPYLRYSMRKIAESIVEIANSELIQLYEIDGIPYMQFIDFEKHQSGLRKDREAPSEIPNPELVRSGSDQTPSLYLRLSLKLNESKEINETKKIYFDFDSEVWKNIFEKDCERWKKTYPGCDLNRELLFMADWLISHPEKKKSNYKSFISRWLKRVQDRGGTKAEYQTSKIGESTHVPTEDEKKRFNIIKAYRKEVEKKYKSKMDKAIKDQDLDMIQKIENTINTEVAQKSQEI